MHVRMFWVATLASLFFVVLPLALGLAVELRDASPAVTTALVAVFAGFAALGVACIFGALIALEPFYRVLMGVKALGKMPAHQDRTVHVEGSKDVVFDRAIQAMMRIGWGVTSDRDAGIVAGTSRWTPFSSGETLKLEVEAVSERETRVHIQSAPRDPGLELDRGKSAVNVQVIAQHLVNPTVLPMMGPGQP